MLEVTEGYTNNHLIDLDREKTSKGLMVVPHSNMIGPVFAKHPFFPDSRIESVTSACPYHHLFTQLVI